MDIGLPMTIAGGLMERWLSSPSHSHTFLVAGGPRTRFWTRNPNIRRDED